MKIGMTLGCPAGIGPEIIIKFFINNLNSLISDDIIIYGDRDVIMQRFKLLNIPYIDMPIKHISSLNGAAFEIGSPSPAVGMASYSYIEEAVSDALKGEIDAIVTCPISKDALNQANINYPGHTEILADKTGTKDYLMMLMGRRLKVCLVTIHCSLRQAPLLLSKERVIKTITILNNALIQDFGLDIPKIAVAGLNPHAGESGLFGDEENIIIVPAIEQCKKEKIRCSGPYPPDTVFYRAYKGEFDACVAMYHDQGLIPFKLIHFEDGVNVTLNLPIVRTSVDHGTAYDIAHKGIASSKSLEMAVEAARDIVMNRQLISLKKKKSQ